MLSTRPVLRPHLSLCRTFLPTGRCGAARGFQSARILANGVVRPDHRGILVEASIGAGG